MILNTLLAEAKEEDNDDLPRAVAGTDREAQIPGRPSDSFIVGYSSWCPEVVDVPVAHDTRHNARLSAARGAVKDMTVGRAQG